MLILAASVPPNKDYVSIKYMSNLGCGKISHTFANT